MRDTLTDLVALVDGVLVGLAVLLVCAVCIVLTLALALLWAYLGR